MRKQGSIFRKRSGRDPIGSHNAAKPVNVCLKSCLEEGPAKG